MIHSFWSWDFEVTPHDPRQRYAAWSCLLIPPGQTSLFIWLLKHPVSQDIHTLKIVLNGTPTPLYDMFCAYGPAGPRHLDLTVDWLASMAGRHNDPPFSLAVCSKLQTFTLRYVIDSKCRPRNPHLSGVCELLAQLDTSSLTTITLSIYVSTSQDEPRRSVQWVQLRALDWKSIEARLSGPKFAGVSKFVANGNGNELPWQAFLDNKFPELNYN